MQCRHTVPDWHRYVDPAADVVPILAACRLLVKEGEPARDPRGIACSYWGHQRDCPLFEGPGAVTRRQASSSERPAARDLPAGTEAMWPVRAPGATDGMRLVMLGLGVTSTALMLVTVAVGLTAQSGKGFPIGYLRLILVAGTLSIVTHVLAVLRTWARR
jgi:hypothetical protein